MKKFIFISYGYKPPTSEIMEAWGKWFSLVSDKILEQAMLGQGTEFSDNGELSLESGEAATGYIVFQAEDLKEAKKIAKGCPIVLRNIIQEIKPMEGSCDS